MDIVITDVLEGKRRKREFKNKLYKNKEAVFNHKIIKPKSCSRCGKKKKLDGHHPDYDKPLKVKWYCRTCHLMIHNRIKNYV